MTVNLSEERVAAPALPVKSVLLEGENFALVGGGGLAADSPVFTVLLHGPHRATTESGLFHAGYHGPGLDGPHDARRA
ncbi:hypothetical protein ABTX62_24010 [Streptomyces sp. NPDC096046]|uniref:hypothetical protein n=1 Tax=Streptomyces sp. NPDC096046 TaxID=3155542 RepID=UPI00331C542F